INLPMSEYRSDRIMQLLEKRKKMDVEYMKDIHYDLYSLQAERFMKILLPLIPDTPQGRILKEWDCRYNTESAGASIFENIYRAILLRVFGDNGLGREAINYLMDETGIFNDYFVNFDNIIM